MLGAGCWGWGTLMDPVAAIKGCGGSFNPSSPAGTSLCPGKGDPSRSLSQACSMLGRTAQLQRPPVNRKDHSNANTAWPGLCGVTPPEGSLAELWANTHRLQRRPGRPRKEK